MKCDVVIIGAGPGGLKVAEILANNNKKVLVLEKNIIIGKMFWQKMRKLRTTSSMLILLKL